MPDDRTPLIFAALRGSTLPVLLLSSIAPSRAKAIFCPAATLGAPQTTVAVSPLTKVHGGQGETVGVRVGVHLQHMADEHLVAVPVAPDLLDGLDLQPGHGKPVGKLSRREVYLDIPFQP